MKCWSCEKPIPENAEYCPHCEARVEPEFTEEERAAAMSLLQSFDPDLLGEIQNALESSESGEDFVNRLMVGDCPQCGGSKTGDCESDPDIEDPCVGRCFDCGTLWCLDCGEGFSNGKAALKHDCPAWDDFDEAELDELL